ncbi:MAG: VCBS repeat-containing protein [Bacteroidales bacterium]|nr:VCBS repeat-containing protein [Bacteroidales bacterium]
MRKIIFLFEFLCIFKVAVSQTTDFDYPVKPDLTTTSSNTVLPLGGVFSVGELGNAAYTIPIEVPSGINGMLPQLSLGYNSLAGNGLCGVGFNLGGFSVISRVSGNYFYDGYTSDVIANNNYVALSLDGRRLINGTNGKYYIENDPNADITLKNNSVTIKQNGKTLIYNPINTSYQNYYLSTVTDNFGNVISYKYFVENGFVYPSTVSYGMGIGSVLISFVYETRNDIVNGFNKIPFQIKKRLCRIDVKKNAAVWRTYNLSYSYYNGFSMLQSITEKNKDGEEKFPANFSWSTSKNSILNSKKEFSFQNSLSLSFKDMICVPGDLNNDGISDVAFVDDHNAYIFMGSRNCTFSFKEKIELSKDISYADKTPDILKYIIASNLVVDIDGDGVSELVTISEPHLSGVNGTKEKPYEINIKACRVGYQKTYDFRFSIRSQEMPAVTIGDFFSNGKNRFVLIDKSAKTSDNKYVLNIYGLGEQNNNYTYNYYNVGLSGRPAGILNGDFDGDGLLDILIVSEGASAVFWNRGTRSGSIFSDANKTVISQINSDCAVVRVGDFDCDGVAEMLYNKKGTSVFYILKNSGNRSFSSATAITLPDIYDIEDSKKDDDKFCVEVTDFNCDGKSDVLISKAMYKRHKNKNYYDFSQNYDYWLTSNGNSLSKYNSSTWSENADPLYYQFITGDFNGDGYQEILRFVPGDKWYIYQTSPTDYYNKIIRITENNGSEISIDYGNLTDNKVYARAGISKYPVVEIAYPLSVVTSVTKNNGIAPKVRTNYKYGQLLTHLKGKGILEYEIKEVIYPDLNQRSYTMIDSWNMEFYVPTKIHTSSSGVYYSYNATETSITKNNGKRYFVYPSKITSTDRYNKTTIIENSYNTALGYLENQKTTFPDNSYKLAKYQNYVLAGGFYQPQLIVNEQKHSDDSKAFSSQQYFEYDTKNGSVKKSVSDYKTDFALTTLYAYDNYGNVLKKTSFGKENDSVSNIYRYDDSHRFVVEETSKPLNSVTKYEYDNFDNLISETDVTDKQNPLKTVYKYDSWGLNNETVFPDGTKQSTIRGWYHISYFVATLGTAIPWTKTTYDNAGHIIKKETISVSSSLNTQTVTTDYSYYNIFNKPEKITTKIGNFTRISTDDYNNSGDLIKHVDNIDTITYNYSYNKTEVTDNGRKTVTEYDCWGNIKKVVPPDNAPVYYVYSSNGRFQAVRSIDAVVSFQYYPNGLKKSITDSDAGTESYEYDSFGRIITQKRGNVVTTNTYVKGLLSKSKCGDITTTYSYDSKNRLKSLSNGRTSISYVYDKFDRRIKEVYSVDNKDFTYLYSYNEIGQLLSKTFPDKSVEKYSYDKYGQISNIYLDKENIWFLYLNSYEKDGLHTTEIMNGVFKDSYFNSDNTLKYVTYGSPNQYSSSDRIDYTYDRYKNLISRKGKNADKETFRYDNYDRLTKINSDYEFQYAQNGNILFQTGIGGYDYKSSQPHAVTGVDNPYGKVKSLQQIVSYTPFRKPATITDNSNKDAVKKYNIYYSPDNERIKTVYSCNSKNVTTYYLPDYEEENSNGVITKRHYVFSPISGNLAAVNFKQGNKNESYYAITDNVGSVLKLVDTGVHDKFSATYTPFGVRTITKNELGYNFPRGFTMHEHLDEFGIINANARLYDPYLARFVSPDPLIQDVTNSQNFNRYSYCLNNPLKYTDPTGEFVWWPVIASTVCGAIIGGISSYKNDNEFWNGALKGGLVGCATGFMVGITPFGNSWYGSTLWGATTGAISDAGMVWASGNNNYSNVWQGGVIGGTIGFLSSEHFQNFVNRKGFVSNNQVIENYSKGLYDIPTGSTWQQETLDYFGMDAKYIAHKPNGGEYVESDGFYGTTNPKTGIISIGDFAFDSYDKLNYTYHKELYHSMKIQNGISLSTQTELGIKYKYYPEERLGFLHTYKNQGLYIKHGSNIISNIQKYTNLCVGMEDEVFQKLWWHFIYKIPRRW